MHQKLSLLTKHRKSFIYSLFSVISMLSLGYCQFFHSTKTQTFVELVKPLQDACQQEGGCPKIPNGWQYAQCVIERLPKEKELFGNDPLYCAIFRVNSTGLGSIYYSTNTKHFYTNWHYYSDSSFYAEGGKEQKLKVTRWADREEAVVIEE